MADSPDSEKAWRPERRKPKVKRIKPSQCHQYEILYHVDPYEIFLPSKKADQLSDTQLQQYKDAFCYYDKNGDGTISPEELRSILASFGQDPTANELQELMTEIDKDESGTIDFSEFLNVMASTTSDQDETEEDLREAFQTFDIGDKGYINTDALKHVMSELGVNLTEEELTGMIKEADSDRDGLINYQDFVHIMDQK